MKQRLFAVSAAAILAVACFQNSSEIDPGAANRLDVLEAALAVRRSDPARALDLIEPTRAGAGLEIVRLEFWLESLEGLDAAPVRWWRFLDQKPGGELAERAWVGLAEALVAIGDRPQAERLLQEAAGSARVDRALLDLAGPGPGRAEAALRLAVNHPLLLSRALSKAEEKAVVARLDNEQLLERCRRWLDLGQPRRVSNDLQGRRWRGGLADRRGQLLAEALTARGRPLSALNALPDRRDLPFESLLQRASAERRLAWQRHPRSSATAAFRRCRQAADRAFQSSAGADQRRRAATLIVECATESDDAVSGLAAWLELARNLEQIDNGDWIGRRFGLALVRSGLHSEALSVGRSLPSQERCIRYWVATAEGSGLAELAAAPVADLYALWAREQLSLEPIEAPVLAPPLGQLEAPSTVAWLKDHASEALASAEWRRIRNQRGATPKESLAAANLELARGQNNRSIRALRSGFAELAGIDLIRLPEDVIKSYLPLRWPEVVKAAAREAGVDPWLIAGLARQESVFTANARSPRGAMGVLQLIPSTAQIHARTLGLGSSPDLFDPHVNIRLGAQEIAAVLADFGALEPALAAYNAGPTRARRWWRQWPNRQRFTEEVPIPETYTYIRRVSFLAEAYRQAYATTWRQAP